MGLDGVQSMADRGFSKKDEALVELLMGTGMAKNVAKTLAFLRKKEETTSVEIRSSDRAQATGGFDRHSRAQTEEMDNETGTEDRGKRSPVPFV